MSNLHSMKPQPPAAKTILITNNITQNGNKMSDGGDKGSSITILTSHHDVKREERHEDEAAEKKSRSTVVLDRIKICINNHFNEKPPITTTTVTTTTTKSEVTKKDEPDTTTAHSPPQSATHEPPVVQNTFTNGQDVLVQHKDGLLYLGTVRAVSRNQCLVKFDDNTKRWLNLEELAKFSSSVASSSPLCVVCKKVNEKETVEVCEKCFRGYHEHCVDGNFGKNGIWYCRMCTAQNRVKSKELIHNGATTSAGTKSVRKEARKTCSTLDNSRKIRNNVNLFHKNQLPYEFDALTWDSYHRVNVEQIYCYCGENGRWYSQMLQCVRCEQWFHENCIQCLKYPLYCGDRFYTFVCSMCNYGNEFIQRIEMVWEDIVHLALFNLTIYNHKTYYNLNSVIIPYIIDNWEILQLPKQLRNLPVSEIKEKIVETLKGNRPRFKSGKEIKKSVSIWGLRTRVPPPVNQFKLPSKIAITEAILLENLPPNVRVVVNSCKPIPESYQKDTKVHNIMMGVSYQNENSEDDDDSLTSTDTNIELIYNSDDEIPIKEFECVARKLKNERDGLSSKSSSIQIISNDLSDEFDRYNNIKDDYTMDVDDSSKLDDDDDYDNDVIMMVPKANLLSSTKQKSIHRSRKSPTNYTPHHTIEICDSSDETSSRGTLDLIIPPPKNFQGKNHPFSSQNMQQIKNGSVPNGKKNKDERKGKNSVKENSKKKATTGNQNAAGAGQFRIVRTVKRRLSAKDILIGPNQEVKRRRIRRRSGHVEVISTQTVHTVSKTAAYLPIRTDSKDWSVSTIRSQITSSTSSSSSTPNGSTTNLPASSISNIFNGRRLRQRQEKNYSDNPRRSSVSGNQNGNNSSGMSFSLPGSPNKHNMSGNAVGSDISISELQTSVNMYFGAASRIANGEKFMIRGKRITPDGSSQYLVEWCGVGNDSVQSSSTIS